MQIAAIRTCALAFAVAFGGCDVSSPAKPQPQSEKLSAADQQLLQAAQTIRRCDNLAAHPDDPEAVAPGVLDDQLDAQAVVAACAAAVKIDAQAPRLRFQAARGFLKADDYASAVEMLLPAAQEGHGGALAYLADMLVDGASGLEPNPLLAISLYQRAVASGFAPAKTLLEQFEDQTDVFAQTELEDAAMQSAAAKPLVEQKIVEPILRGDLDAVAVDETWAKWYLVFMTEEIYGACESRTVVFDALRNHAGQTTVDLAALGPEGLPIYLTRQALAALLDLGDAERHKREWEEWPGKAMNDAFAVLARHPCGTAELSTFLASAVAFITDKGAPAASTVQLFSACTRRGGYGRFAHCGCWVGALNDSSLWRLERKALTAPGEFEAAAASITKRSPKVFAPCATMQEELARRSAFTSVTSETPSINAARVKAACENTIRVAHTSPTLMTTGDVDNACTCVGTVYERSPLSKTPFILRALERFEQQEILVTERAVDAVEAAVPRGSGTSTRDDARQLAFLFHKCTEAVGISGFYSGRWLGKTGTPVPIMAGAARFPVSLQ